MTSNDEIYNELNHRLMTIKNVQEGEAREKELDNIEAEAKKHGKYEIVNEVQKTRKELNQST